MTDDVRSYDLWAGYETLRGQVRQWVDDAVVPHVDEWEAAGEFPRSLFRYAGAEGLFGWKVEPELGGHGLDLVADAVVTDELAGCWSGGVAAALGAHKDLGSWYIARFGDDGQRAQHLPGCVRGDVVTGLAVTEPEAGSDVAGIRTRAVQQPGGDWVLDGAKTFITNGAWGDLLVVAAVTEEDRDPHHALSLFLVEAGDAGFSAQRIPTLGWRTSQTGALALADVRLPADRLLGGETMRGEGFICVMRNFQSERISMALGATRAAADLSALVDVGELLRAEIAAARSLTEHAFRLMLDDRDAVRETSMAKWYACEVAQRVAEAAVHRLGVNAIYTGRAERGLRDARLGPIGGGTTQIMKELVGRSYGL